MDKVKAVKEMLVENCQTHEHRDCDCSPADAEGCWGALATQICQLFERPKVKLPKAREYNYIVDRCISVEGVFRAGEEYILQQVKELNDMEVEE